MKTIAQQLNIKEFPFIIKDKTGNEIYSEDSNGFWYKNEFDSSGNEIYSEDSNGFWFRREFDLSGNEIYYEDSTGVLKDDHFIPEYTMEELVEKLGNFKIKK